MTKDMTVAELIALLQVFPQDLHVEMSMNGEYQEIVKPDMIEVEEFRGRRYLIIRAD